MALVIMHCEDQTEKNWEKQYNPQDKGKEMRNCIKQNVGLCEWGGGK
jgi:hypothetical protein